MKTEVINCRDRKAVEKAKREGRYVYVGRPSKWGNPYRLRNIPVRSGVPYDDPREECLRFYEQYLRRNPTLMGELFMLRGKVLGCWCAPSLCHGHVLARLADMLPGPVPVCDERPTEMRPPERRIR